MVRPTSCPDCGADAVGFEYNHDSKWHYDGISEYVCAKGCGWRVGRWCGTTLVSNQCEPRYCDGVGHPREINL